MDEYRGNRPPPPTCLPQAPSMEVYLTSPTYYSSLDVVCLHHRAYFWKSIFESGERANRLNLTVLAPILHLSSKAGGPTIEVCM